VKGVISDFDRIDWKGRAVLIAFDARLDESSQAALFENAQVLEFETAGSQGLLAAPVKVPRRRDIFIRVFLHILQEPGYAYCQQE
jgi:hypothetical protein